MSIETDGCVICELEIVYVSIRNPRSPGRDPGCTDEVFRLRPASYDNAVLLEGLQQAEDSTKGSNSKRGDGMAIRVVDVRR
jgi:hypothetical protein